MIRTRIFLFLFVLSFVSWVSWFRYGNLMPEWLSVVLSIWNWLVGPIVIISMANLAKEELDFENPCGVHWTLVRILVGTPLGFFGLVFIATGLGMMAFAIWAVFTSGDPKTFEFFCAFGMLSLGVAMGGRMIYSAFFRRGPTRKEIEERQRWWEERLQNPDWDFYESCLERPVPAILKERYGEPEEFLLPILDGEDLAAHWSPIHASEVITATGAEADLLPFARGTEGGFLFLRPGAEAPDRIYLTDSDEAEKFFLLHETPDEFFEALDDLSQSA